jgi:site-specific DNA-methyltransferase (adenine-specific)
MLSMRLMLGDCLALMSQLEPGSVDLVLADLPYGTTACRWDSVIPFGPLWAHYRRLLKPDGAVVLTACQPFSTKLINSNPKWFRYELVWDKVSTTGFLDANRRPMRRHELVLVFSPKAPPYRPQFEPGEPYRTTRKGKAIEVLGNKKATLQDRETVNLGRRYPTSIIRFSNSTFAVGRKVHPTQKPLALMDYLVRTFSDAGDLVLDNTMGSGTTGEACQRAGRRFVGIEADPGYFELATRRLDAARVELAASA